jgi:hypothetical protein
MKVHRPKLVFLMAAIVAVTLAPSARSATPPERHTITFSGTEHPEWLSAACGVDVTLNVTVRLTVLLFEDRLPGVPNAGPYVLESSHVELSAIAGDNVVRFTSATLTFLRTEPDGTLIYMVAGHSPFSLTGLVMVENPFDGGETIIFPKHEADLTHACRLLTQ